MEWLSLASVGCQVEVDKAVEAARQAFDIRSPWRRLEPAARGQLMRTFASLLRRDLDYLSVSSFCLPSAWSDRMGYSI